MTSGVDLRVNGTEHHVEVAPDTPLLYVLRNELDLVGPRFGCGLGQCGACAVLVDGRETRSCVMPMAEVAGKDVTTLEGLPMLWAQQRDDTGPAPAFHPLQQAWIDEQVAQCGYCQPGMMIQAAELLATTSDPSEDEIRRSMDGHLCRCGTYPRIVNAIRRAAEVMAKPEAASLQASDDQHRAGAPQASGGRARRVGFSFQDAADARRGAAGAAASGGPPDAGQIDSWIVIHADNTASILTGHQELGQGSATGLLMIAGEELDLDLDQLRFVTEDTALTPNTFPSTTSEGMPGTGPSVRAAAAAAKRVLLDLAADELGVPVHELSVQAGVVSAGGRSVTYAELVGGREFQMPIPAEYNLDQSKMPGWNGTAGLLAGAPGTKPVSQYRLVGTRASRVDIPAKAAGTYRFVHDVRLPGMLHGRVVLPRGQRGYGAGAPVVSLDETSIADIPGARVVRRGDFVGVVAASEWDAIRAGQQLKVSWADAPPLPGHQRLFAHMRELGATGSAKVSRTVDTGDVEAALVSAAHAVTREYSFPYNAHATIGPGCAVADVTADGAVIYSNSQTTRELQAKAAAVLDLPEDSVRVRWVEGSGSFGGSPGRFEAPIAAAIMSQLAGQPVRVQLMRWDDHGWDNYGMPQLMDVRAGADAEGRITALDYTIIELPFPVTTYTMEGLVGRPYAEPQAWDPSTDVTGSQYTIPNWRLTSKTLPILDSGFLKTDFLRSPIAIGASFAVEQAVDELAFLAQMDPVEFRRHNVQTENTHPQANFLWLGMYDTSDRVPNKERWLAVLDSVAEAAQWQPRVASSLVSADEVVKGRGVALAGTGSGAYSCTYAAAAAEIEVNKATGEISVQHVYTSQDYGLVINPDLVQSQAEGMTIQAVSRLLKEEVLFDEASVTSLDWESYPIARFTEAPRVTHVAISRPEITPGPGSEELMPAVTAAIANAFFDATGVRMTSAPFTPAKVRAALGAAGGRLGEAAGG